MELRNLERAAHIVLGSFSLYFGVTSNNVNYEILFFLLSAMFFLAVFRPSTLP
ncbi:MAG TPA: hypothetical protein VMW81_00530 [Nitrospinota bacterium]|nr:hypothetical protein [Nitrospinota bacterium]